MKKIVLATANQHKVNEINQILDGKIEFIGLDELGFDGEIPEDQLTIEGNAHQNRKKIARSLARMECQNRISPRIPQRESDGSGQQKRVPQQQSQPRTLKAKGLRAQK